MGLLGAIGGAFAGSKLTDIVGGFFGNMGASGFVSDILGGAITNAAVAGLAGGSIGKAALFGAAGGALGGMGSLGSIAGGAVSGYGLAESLGQKGYIGALAGGAGAFANDRFSTPSAGTTGGTAAQRNAQRNVAQNGNQPAPAGAPPQQGTAQPGAITQKLASMGLVDQNGEGTLLGKALVTGIGGVAQNKLVNKQLEKQHDQTKELIRTRAESDHDAEQKRIGAFTNRQPSFQVVRNV